MGAEVSGSLQRTPATSLEPSSIFSAKSLHDSGDSVARLGDDRQTGPDFLGAASEPGRRPLPSQSEVRGSRRRLAPPTLAINHEGCNYNIYAMLRLNRKPFKRGAARTVVAGSLAGAAARA
eukprot:scaffold27311_cov39-Phaeocystis_antarctica.AAC.2